MQFCNCFKAFGCPKLGWPVQDRATYDSDRWTMVSVDLQFTCEGLLVEWRYQAKASNPFRAIVWRPVNGSDTEFQIVGINDIPAGEINTPVTYTVPENDRIEVQAGDLIGWSSVGLSSLAFDSGVGVHRILWKRYLNDLDVNQIRTIDRGNQLREYSIEATVEPFDMFDMFQGT